MNRVHNCTAVPGEECTEVKPYFSIGPRDAVHLRAMRTEAFDADLHYRLVFDYDMFGTTDDIALRPWINRTMYYGEGNNTQLVWYHHHTPPAASAAPSQGQ